MLINNNRIKRLDKKTSSRKAQVDLSNVFFFIILTYAIVLFNY